MLSDTPLILLFHRIHRAGLQLERLNLDVDPDDGIKELLEAIRDKLRSLGPRDQVRRQPLKLLRHDLRMIMISAFLPDERAPLLLRVPNVPQNGDRRHHCVRAPRLNS